MMKQLLMDTGNDFDKLPDRVQFAKQYDTVEKELRDKLTDSSSGGCIIC